MQWPLDNHPEFHHFKFVSHRSRIPRQFCLRALIAANFASSIILAANFAGKISRRPQFFAGAVFRRRRFSPAAVFAALTLHAALKNTNSALLLPVFKKASKAATSYFHAPCRCWRKIAFLSPYHGYHNRNCMSTTHSNFQILQFGFFAGISLCRLVAISITALLIQNSISGDANPCNAKKLVETYSSELSTM